MAEIDTLGEDDEEYGLDALDKKLIDDLKETGFDNEDLIHQFAQIAKELDEKKD